VTDQPDQPAEVAGTLQYARGAVVGAVRVERRADGFVLTVARLTPVLRAGFVVLFAGAIAMTAVGAVWVRHTGGRWRGEDVFTMVWLGAVAASLLWWGGNLLSAALRSRVIQKAGDEIVLTFRAERQLGRLSWRSDAVAEVQCRRGAFWSALGGSAWHVRAVLLDGLRVELLVGTRDEGQFVRDVLLDELDCPRTEWVERGFWRPAWFRRIKLRADPCGIQIRKPPAIGFLVPVLPFLGAAAGGFVAALVQHRGGRSWARVLEDPAMSMLGGVIGLVVGLIAAIAISNGRRTAVISLNPKSLVIDEQSYYRPALTEYPTAILENFVAGPAGRAWQVEVIAPDGGRAVVLSRLRERDAARLCDALVKALARARSGSPLPPGEGQGEGVSTNR
jgi:hypothetical protein